jgi:hypothetical protein
VLRFGSISAQHRDTTVVKVFYDVSVSTKIKGIEVVVALLKHDNRWWIVPNAPADEDRFKDIGPFDTAEAAYAALRLLA